MHTTVNPQIPENTARFAGFEEPQSNYFKMPNIWTNITAEIDSLAEMKVIEYVLRHTWGFREFGLYKVISIDEFMYGRKHSDGSRMDAGTGLKSDRSVRDGLQLAIKHGYLICKTDTSDKARIKKAYSLNMREKNVPESGAHSLSKSKKQIHQRKQSQAIPSYIEYLQTEEWQARRKKALQFAHFRCQVCNSPEDLNVHHRTYERLGHEHMGDLITLCRNCHEIFHNNAELSQEEE